MLTLVTSRLACPEAYRLGAPKNNPDRAYPGAPGLHTLRAEPSAVLTLDIVRVAHPERHRQGPEAFAYPGHLFALSMLDRCLCPGREFTPGATTLAAVPENFFRAARPLTLVTRPPFFNHGPPPPPLAGPRDRLGPSLRP
jgi:hypothetical protein